MKNKFLYILVLLAFVATGCAGKPTVFVQAKKLGNESPNVTDVAFVFVDKWVSKKPTYLDEQYTILVRQVVSSMEEHFPKIFKLNNIEISTMRKNTINKKELKKHGFIMTVSPKSIVKSRDGTTYGVNVMLYKSGSITPVWGGPVYYRTKVFDDPGYKNAGKYLAEHLLKQLNADGMVKLKNRKVIMPPEEKAGR